MSLEQADSRTFSDAWHRVAGVRAMLRTSVQAHRQFFRGEPWVVLRDKFSNEWFRVSPDAYAFLCRLDGRQTLDEVWNAALAADASRSLTQEEVVQLLGQLNLSNLLQYDRGDAASSQFERFSKRRARELQAMLMGFLSLKIPLWDPDRFLNHWGRLIHALYSPMGLLLYALLLMAGGKALMDESRHLFDQSAGLLAPANLGLLYLGFLISKLLHEMSHAAACKRFGGEVHKLGVMLLIFAPMPYVDATSAWGFRQRRERLLVGLAGVLAELALAAVAALLWAHTAPGTLNALAYNVIFVASVSTLVFNLNPLLRFDGYHIAVDLFDVPNLYQRSREQLRYLAERHLLRLPHAQPAARTPTEAVLLPAYGIASILYWVLLMSTIIFFIAGEYLDLGVAMAWMMFFTAVVLPLYKFVHYLMTNPQLGYHRGRAVAVSGGLSALALGLLFGIPLPDQVRVTGIVEARQSRELHAETEGFFVELLARPGSQVTQGQPLLRLDNPQLGFDIQAARMQLEQIQAQEIQALSRSVADLAGLARQREAVEQTLADLLRRQQALLVKAPVDGTWSASELDASRGQWMGRGAAMGTVLNPEAWRFVAVLPQVGSHIFHDRIAATEVRLKGQEGINLKAETTTILPFEQGQLPSRALGMAGGGDLAVSPADPHGLTAAEPFFRIEAALPGHMPEDLLLTHGRTGTMRLTLSSRPLGVQWERKLRQFFQRRFRV